MCSQLVLASRSISCRGVRGSKQTSVSPLKKEMPSRTSLSHLCILGYIRRVNLDAMWSRESATVSASSLAGLKKQKKIACELDLPMPSTRRGPWEVIDSLGMQMAIAILRQLQEPGRNNSA